MSDIAVSVVMATFNKAAWLQRTLESIYAQLPSCAFEVIVVDDGSTDETPGVLSAFPVRRLRLERSGRRNPGPARNVGYRAAAGEIIIAQSDDVEHKSPQTIQRLVDHLTPSTCVFAKVLNVGDDGSVLGVYCSPQKPRPYFFLGALWRADLYAVGGDDEEFTDPEGGEDRWLAARLANLGRQFIFCSDIVGWHYDHQRPLWQTEREARAKRMAYKAIREAKAGRRPWTPQTGAWA